MGPTGCTSSSGRAWHCGRLYKAYEVEPKADDPTDDGNRRKTSIVLNIHQITGCARPPSPTPRSVSVDPWQPLEPVEDFIATTGANIRHGGEQAYFHRTRDFIQMPARTSFVGTYTSTPLEAYYAVLLHELTHWTGASSRLTRMCLGAAASAVTMAIFDTPPLPPIFAAIGVIPAVVDGVRSYFTIGGTTNSLRAATGMTLGIAVAAAFS